MSRDEKTKPKYQQIDDLLSEMCESVAPPQAAPTKCAVHGVTLESCRLDRREGCRVAPQAEAPTPELIGKDGIYHCCVHCGWIPIEGMAEYVAIHGKSAECIQCGKKIEPGEAEAPRGDQPRIARLLREAYNMLHEDFSDPDPNMQAWHKAWENSVVEALEANSAPSVDIEQKYHRVMSLLRQIRMEHGLCKPRERRACTACNAQESLDQMVNEYKGARIVQAQTKEKE